MIKTSKPSFSDLTLTFSMICLLLRMLDEFHFHLKVVSATFLLVFFLCLEESTFETRKDVFYFASEALFILEIIKFNFLDIQMS